MNTKKLAIIISLTVLLLLGVVGIKFTPLERATNFSRWLLPYSLTGFSSIGQRGDEILETAEAAQTFVPDPNSPIGKKDHPRLYLTKDNLPGIRSKIENYYRSEFQQLINWVDGEYNKEPATISYLGLGDYILNYSFMYKIGQLTGFNYAHTIDEYRDKAKAHLLYKARNLPGAVFYEYTPEPVGYDWLYEVLAPDEKIDIVNSLILIHETVKDYYTGNDSSPFWNRRINKQIALVGGLAFYGDGINDAKAQEMVDLFGPAVFESTGSLYAENWAAGEEGSFGGTLEYSTSYSFNYLLKTIGAWYTATGEDVFTNSPAYRYYVKWPTYLILPFADLNPSKPGGYSYRVYKDFAMTPGLEISYWFFIYVPLFPFSILKDTYPDMAGLASWLAKERTGISYGVWEYIWGGKDVDPMSPQELNLPLTQRFEPMGWVVMRTGWDSLDDTLTVFRSSTYPNGDYFTGGHMGSFSIYKWGPLTMNTGGGAHHNYQETSYAYNTMVFPDPNDLYDYGNADRGGQLTNYLTPSTAIDINDIKPGSVYDIGGIKRFESVNNEYDYMYADSTKTYSRPDYHPYNEAKIDLFTRQYVYLRPPTNQDSDYFVIFDRTRTVDTKFEKRWLLHMSYEPEINGQGVLEREGEWVYDNADLVTITNDYGSAHGRLFSKTLLPEQHKIVKIGGPNHEYDVLGENFVLNENVPIPLSEADAFWRGSYRTEVIPTDNQTYNTFLHVLQTADSSVPSMVSTSRIDGDTMVGAYIQDDTQGHKVVMFSKTEANQAQVSYSISSSQPVKHLIADLYPYASYEVYQNGKQIDTVGVSEAGTIYFNSEGGGDFQIIGVGINYPPTVAVSANPTSGTAPLTVQFTSTAQDSDGSIASYSWNFGDSSTSTEQNPSHTYTNPGTYTATLTVTDNQGATASDTITITVNTPPPDSTPPTIPQGLSIIGQYETSISLTWQACSDPESGVASYKIYRDDALITTTQQTSYTDTGLTVNTTYSYQVSAVNGAGLESAKSTAQSVTTQADTTPPTVVSVTTESTTQVKIVFSETIEEISAEEPSNYNIDQGITIFSASLATNQTTVTLITSALNEQSTYTLTINNIIDKATYPNTIAPNTTVTFRGTNFIAHWTFDEGTGQTAQDYSPGQGNPGTIHGATWTTGKINGALEFNGSNAYVEIPSSEELKLTTNGTIAAWIKVNTFPGTVSSYIIHRGANRWSNFYSLGFGKGAYANNIEVYFTAADLSYQIWRTSYVFSTDTWYHIAAAWDGNTIKFYVNGVENGSTHQTVIPQQTDGRVTIGAFYDTYNFNGPIDDVRIYDRGLSAEEILALYQQGTQPKLPNLTLTKSADIATAKSGDIITYTIAYQNIGTGEARNIIITDPIPQGTTYVTGSADATAGSFDGTQVVWNIGEVKAGGSGNVGFQVRVE